MLGRHTHIKKTSKYTLIRFSWRDQQREENHIKLFKDKRVRRRTANQHLYLWSVLHSRTRNFHHALHSNCIRLLIYFYFFLSFNKCNVLTVDWYPPRKRNESCLVMITKVSPQWLCLVLLIHFFLCEFMADLSKQGAVHTPHQGRKDCCRLHY